jgi:hypothetical protein
VCAAVVCWRRPAKLNETPEVHRGSRAPDEKKRLEQREIIPLHGKFEDRRRRPCGLSGQIIRPPFRLRPLRGGVEAAAEVPEVLALVQVHALQDRSDVHVERPVVENDVLVAPERNTWQGHAILSSCLPCDEAMLFSPTRRRSARRIATDMGSRPHGSSMQLDDHFTNF